MLLGAVRLVDVLAAVGGRARRLEAGEYALSRGMSLDDILRRLAAGDVVTVQVTIPEGFTVEEIIDALVKAGLGPRAGFEAACSDRALVADFTPAAAAVRWPVEGFLFPATYTFRHDLSPRQIIATMVEQFRRTWAGQLSAAGAAEGFTADQAVTLASIVEREARVDAERPIIAGVYANRLRKGMNLNADPTVFYALGRAQGGRLTVKDLKLDSPFNTYAHAGLPPGPIASPGVRSLAAAVQPAAVPYLYFVARADGTHVFSATLHEQLANRKKFQGY